MNSDKTWYNDLQATKWLQRISIVLKMSTDIAQLLDAGTKNVIIKGECTSLEGSAAASTDLPQSYLKIVEQSLLY